MPSSSTAVPSASARRQRARADPAEVHRRERHVVVQGQVGRGGLGDGPPPLTVQRGVALPAVERGGQDQDDGEADAAPRPPTAGGAGRPSHGRKSTAYGLITIARATSAPAETSRPDRIARNVAMAMTAKSRLTWPSTSSCA